ncbi:MAG: DUF1800 domain-containing protein [Gemmatimonadaceae bacterium]|nr:DUF1800 domain-containing protein [Gemmatimonadaceae bacterium]
MPSQSVPRHATLPLRLTIVPGLLALAAACATGAGGTPAGAAAAAAQGLPTPDAVSVAAREQTADQQVLHALNRLAFGPRPGDVQRVREVGVDRWIALQLEPKRISDAAGEAAAGRYGTLAMPLPVLLDSFPPNPVLRRLLRQAAAGARRDSQPFTRDDSLAYQMARRRAQVVGQQLVSARVARALASERQLDEVLTDFWLNHFSVYAGKGAAMRHYLVSYERDAIRPHVLGKFRTLLGAVAHSPAMLFYLDNWESAADSGRPRLVPVRAARAAQRRAVQRAPALAGMQADRRDTLVARLQQRRRGLNENYARELMELHTMGVDGGYTQQDVSEAARILTGWTIERLNEAAAFRFNPALHDAGAKVVLGTAFPAGVGVAEGERLLDLLVRQPATARFIASKLVQRFVSDTPPASLVARAAATFTRTDGDLREVVRTIVTSEEFFAAAAWRAKVKSPFEVVVSALRALDAPVDTSPRTAALVARLGQPIFQHQAPNGWPELGDGWINTGAILNRINFGMALAAGSVPGVRVREWPTYATLEPLPRDQQVDGVVRALLGGTVSADMRAILQSGDHPMLERARAVADTALPAAVMAPRRTDGGGLVQVIGLALGSPEFQRR